MGARTIEILRRSLFNRASRKAIDPTYSPVIALSGVGVKLYVVRASMQAKFTKHGWPAEYTLGLGESGRPGMVRSTLGELIQDYSKPPTPRHCKFCQLVHSEFSTSVR
jgi:hypothetical protein